MCIKLLILFLLLAPSVFAQDSLVFPNLPQSQNKSQEELSKVGSSFIGAVGQIVVESAVKGIRKPRKAEFNDIKAQHWIGITFGVDGVTFPSLQNTTLPSRNIGAELFLGKGFYFYSKLGTYSTLPDHRLYNKIDYGTGMNIVVGFGGYVYNDRSWYFGSNYREIHI